MSSRRLVFFGAVLLLSVGASPGRAQDTSATPSGSRSDSLGDAARKARAQKKDSSKPAKVFTNEDLGGLKGTVSVIGNDPAAASGSDKAAGSTEDKKPADGADAKPTNTADVKPANGVAAKDLNKEANKDEPKNDEGYWRAKFAAARKVLAQDNKELDILQREFNLKQQQYSRDPNWAMHEQYSRADINKTQQEIDAKRQDVENDKQALSDLEDELRKSGGDPGWANAP